MSSRYIARVLLDPIDDEQRSTTSACPTRYINSLQRKIRILNFTPPSIRQPCSSSLLKPALFPPSSISLFLPSKNASLVAHFPQLPPPSPPPRPLSRACRRSTDSHLGTGRGPNNQSVAHRANSYVLSLILISTDATLECQIYYYAPTGQAVAAGEFPPAWTPATIVANDTNALAKYQSIQSQIPNIQPNGYQPDSLEGNWTNYTYPASDPNCWWTYSGCTTPKLTGLSPDLSSVPEVCSIPFLFGPSSLPS